MVALLAALLIYSVCAAPSCLIAAARCFVGRRWRESGAYVHTTPPPEGDMYAIHVSIAIRHMPHLSCGVCARAAERGS